MVRPAEVATAATIDFMVKKKRCLREMNCVFFFLVSNSNVETKRENKEMKDLFSSQEPHISITSRHDDTHVPVRAASCTSDARGIKF